MRHIATVVLRIGWLLCLFAGASTAQTYTPLFTYAGTNNNTSGVSWPSVFAQGQDGSLYNTLDSNGSDNAGSVYKMTTGGQYTLLYSFCQEGGHCLTSGGFPTGGVTLGFDGNLWGTTSGGGTNGAGTIFKTTPTGITTTLYSFANGADDSAPFYAPVQGQDGNFYGVSETQYAGQYGAFYKITTKGKLTPHPFDPIKSWTPNLPVQGTDGNFYGTTQGGGDPTCKCGAVYKATAAGKLTVLYRFQGFANHDGYRPTSILTQGSDGNFYGTTYQGGSGNNAGTVFKITPTGKYTLLYSFGSVAGDGTLPLAGLTQGPDGNFYGTTSAGGSKNAGTIFKITPAGKVTILNNFCAVSCSNGFGPTTPMVLHTNGKFYGTTAGNSLGGSVFYSLDVGFKPLVDLVTWSAKVGKTVEILGQGFTGTTAVSFNGVAAKFNNSSDTYMTATVPDGALSGPVTVTTFTSTLTSNRSFLVNPQVKSFSPASGTVGTSVTITGVSLTQTTGVTIGGKAASFVVNSDKQVTATVPAGAKTGKKITVTTPGGTGSSPTTFAVVPSITGFSPPSGPVGTAVAIAGNSFTGTTKVTFGGVAATSYQVIKDTEVDALVPTGAVTGPIVVTTPGGSGTSATNFTVTK
jgi:uncharacterized repeat protein (TIGR03803 family)